MGPSVGCLSVLSSPGAREPVLSRARPLRCQTLERYFGQAGEIRQQYNDELQKSADKLLSEEGIKDAASEDLGLVMPGEKRIEVQGLDDDSDSSSSKKSSNAKKASEVAKEIEEVGKDAPWYIQALDMLFGFNGVEGQTVVSNGK